MAVKMRNKLLELIQNKEREQRRKIPQSEIASDLSISVNTLKRWIRQDVTRYDEEVITAIYDYFGITEPNQLFYFEEVDVAE